MDEKANNFLLNEYANALEEPTYAEITVNRRKHKLLVPFSYAMNAFCQEDAIDHFTADFFEHNDTKIEKTLAEYAAAGKAPQFVQFDNIELPVPLELINKTDREQQDTIFNEALQNYERAINVYRMANSLNLTPGYTEIDSEKVKGLEQKILLAKKEKLKVQKDEKISNFPKQETAKKSEPATASASQSEKTPNKTDMGENIFAEEPSHAPRQRITLFRTGSTRLKIMVAAVAFSSVSVTTFFKKCSSQKTDEIENTKESNISGLELSAEEIAANRWERIFHNIAGEEGGYGNAEANKYGLTQSNLEKARMQYKKQLGAFNKDVDKLSKAEVDSVLKVGGYKKVGKIDQETNYGLTNPTLQLMKKQYASLKDVPSNVADLSYGDAEKVYFAYYTHYKLDKVKNDDLAEMLMDIYVNHSYTTANEFLDAGYREVLKKRGSEIPKGKAFNIWNAGYKKINKFTQAETSLLYKTIAGERKKFLHRPGYVKEFKGLLQRADKYAARKCQPNRDTTIQLADIMKMKNGKEMN